MAFNRLLVLKHLHIVIHLFKRAQDYRLTFLIELRPTCTTEDLLDIKHPKVFISTGT